MIQFVEYLRIETLGGEQKDVSNLSGFIYIIHKII